MSALAKSVIDGLRSRLGHAVDDFAVAEVRDSPTPWLTLECTLFEFLPVTFIYDRGRCGFSVDYGSRKMVLARPNTPRGLTSATDLEQLLNQAVIAAKQRIPDKYLEAKGWL